MCLPHFYFLFIVRRPALCFRPTSCHARAVCRLVHCEKKFVKLRLKIFQCFCRNFTSGCTLTTRKSEHFGCDIHTSQRRVSCTIFKKTYEKCRKCTRMNLKEILQCFIVSLRECFSQCAGLVVVGCGGAGLHCVSGSVSRPTYPGAEPERMFGTFPTSLL